MFGKKKDKNKKNNNSQQNVVYQQQSLYAAPQQQVIQNPQPQQQVMQNIQPQQQAATETLQTNQVNNREQAISKNVGNKTEKVQRPVKRYRYTIINGVGKKEQGTFEAESENDVRNFLLSQEYQVLEVKERSASDIDIGGNSKIGANDLSFSSSKLKVFKFSNNKSPIL